MRTSLSIVIAASVAAGLAGCILSTGSRDDPGDVPLTIGEDDLCWEDNNPTMIPCKLPEEDYGQQGVQRADPRDIGNEIAPRADPPDVPRRLILPIKPDLPPDMLLDVEEIPPTSEPLRAPTPDGKFQPKTLAK